MSWLLREGDVLAAVEERRKGWQAALQGALILRGPVIVQTLTRPATGGLDVAWCSPATLDGGQSGLRVRRITRVPARWVSPPHVGPGAAGRRPRRDVRALAAAHRRLPRSHVTHPTGRLILVGTPIGNLDDLSPARRQGSGDRRRDLLRGHPPYPQAAERCPPSGRRAWSPSISTTRPRPPKKRSGSRRAGWPSQS